MTVRILQGDVLDKLAELPDESVQCCVTSPPYYGLRCYDTEGQIGLEATPEAHIARLVEVFGEVKRVLRKDGVLWLNYGDAYATGNCGGGSVFDAGRTDGRVSYEGDKARGRDATRSKRIPANYKPKDLLMLPARVALALQADGWWLRSMMPWLKRSAMPESATDRPATAIEYVFMLTKSARYFFDMEAVRQVHAEPWRSNGKTEGKNARPPSEHDGRGRFHRAGEVPREYNPAGRNFRNSDLFFSSLEPPHGLISDAEGAPLALDVNPAGFADAHFATFPPKLIEPLIKAATSEKGCCPACAAPWVREVEGASGGAIGAAWLDHTHDSERGAAKIVSSKGYNPGKTLGWSPSCDCVPDPVPCVILDCFGGAGTTGLVADRLGRDAILIELNPNYAEMARKRIAGDAPLFAEVQA